MANLRRRNRQRCAEAARPLLQAVDELTMFASSPEFASVLAKIGPQVCNCSLLNLSKSRFAFLFFIPS
jgi:hypothetical protein